MKVKIENNPRLSYIPSLVLSYNIPLWGTPSVLLNCKFFFLPLLLLLCALVSPSLRRGRGGGETSSVLLMHRDIPPPSYWPRCANVRRHLAKLPSGVSLAPNYHFCQDDEDKVHHQVCENGHPLISCIISPIGQWASVSQLRVHM